MVYRLIDVDVGVDTPIVDILKLGFLVKPIDVIVPLNECSYFSIEFIGRYIIFYTNYRFLIERALYKEFEPN